MENARYLVYWAGSETGRTDGEIISTFETETEAVEFAEKLLNECEDEFDECCYSGIAISDSLDPGNQVEW